MKLEDVCGGQRLSGVIPGDTITVIAAQRHGQDALELTFRSTVGTIAQQILFRGDEQRIQIAQAAGRPFDAPASDFKLAAEAQRIRLAGLFDPMLAVATSDVQPLPHQITAVYGELLPRTPLRFLLADDPGAGKTIMAGLYIKELLLRDDVKRCLVVAPGGLVDQWQDELFFKFGLHFEILTNALIDANININVFERHPLLIARMDQLSRNEDLQAKLSETEWDLIVVDEAHRMAAHYFAGKLEKTRRFELGELLGSITRHFLLMTATPHSGIEQDFQLFLTLIDKDRFEGRYRAGVHHVDTSDVMRRMVKEKLLTFEGKPLFPQRIAETVPYELTSLEQALYEQVTDYVRQGFDRADRLADKRRNTVGFALTVLQRRLASSPEAILRSLERRIQRLQRRKSDMLNGTYHEDARTVDPSVYDEADDYTAEEMESVEEELVDAATAAQTVAELDTELAELAGLAELARRVRDSGNDRKWSELSTILQDPELRLDRNGHPRKLIIFTEHRDTLHYLERRVSSLLGRVDAVVSIHGAVSRPERRRITEEFTKNPECQILIATDAAGEGLNLQAANLMVNYDLPWNPNRIEQRFGRIHRIGQTEVCRLWNLVATNTREGEVFNTLLSKIEEQRRAYGGEVFDVLGEAFESTPLRALLMNAIRYGELPETRAKMQQVIDKQVGEGLPELLKERALASEVLSKADLAGLRQSMDEARARRLQPHYIELAFREAFTRLGGRLARREKGRFEATNVPSNVRAATSLPIATHYARVTFDLPGVQPEGLLRADLLAPGHPLHDAVMTEAARLLRPALEAGTVLVSAAVTSPQLLVGVVEEVVDGTDESISRRFSYAFVDQSGRVTDAGPAPYLDAVAAPEGRIADGARRLPWLPTGELQAVSWLIENRLPAFLAEVQPRRREELEKVRRQVNERLTSERDRLYFEAAVAGDQERAGQKAKESSESLNRKAQDLETRLTIRLRSLAQQEQLATRPPRILAAAVVLPLAEALAEIPQDEPLRHAVETKEVERRGVDAVLAYERHLGRQPVEQAFNNPGFDILSSLSDGSTIRIEVKARIEGSDDFFISHNEVLTGKNAAPRYRLALVRVDQRGASYDEVRYVDDPFATTTFGEFDATGLRGDWAKMWARGVEPF